ncbi:LarC family nickel insertion protein [Marinivivus vitaminiproducens]|uniref:LarC family nickel insertion protein n=1 Tax=Marinivivus vitaminiproducens TaxID=3035935 RepID=UPI0027A126BC|nr:LarC family nickel insertion protein [Geminicoccaceae bacterium SCSIO 64248]
MRRIHLDAVGGVAGDMFAAAMLDALPELRSRVLADAASVLPPHQGSPAVTEGQSGMLRALRFGLAGHATASGHDHHHDTGFRELVLRIEAADLTAGTSRHAIAILTRLAEVEARIHDVPLDEVHFHEIGDWDSLLDVVAAGSIAAALEGSVWSVSTLPLGGGLVRTQHGPLPVPAPATAALLEGFAWQDDGVAGERVTPTGAAILCHLVRDPAAAHGSGRLAATGYGAGTRELSGMANVLRALVFDEAGPADADTVTVIAFDIDDMTGEEIGTAAERLRATEGVLDLVVSPGQGKKHRPVHLVRLLVRPDAAEAVAERCFAETSTLGVRRREERRLVLPRESARPGVKTARRPGGVVTAKAESDGIAGDSLDARRRAARAAEDAAS